MPKRTSSGSMPRCSARPPPTPPRMRSVRDRVRRLGWGGGCGGGVAATGSVGSWSPSVGGGVSMTGMLAPRHPAHHWESPLGNDPGDPRGDPMWQPGVSCRSPGAACSAIAPRRTDRRHRRSRARPRAAPRRHYRAHASCRQGDRRLGADVVDPLAWTGGPLDRVRRGGGARARASALRARAPAGSSRRRAASTATGRWSRASPAQSASTRTRSRRWSSSRARGDRTPRRSPSSTAPSGSRRSSPRPGATCSA